MKEREAASLGSDHHLLSATRLTAALEGWWGVWGRVKEAWRGLGAPLGQKTVEAVPGTSVLSTCLALPFNCCVCSPERRMILCLRSFCYLKQKRKPWLWQLTGVISSLIKATSRRKRSFCWPWDPETSRHPKSPLLFLDLSHLFPERIMSGGSSVFPFAMAY